MRLEVHLRDLNGRRSFNLQGGSTASEIALFCLHGGLHAAGFSDGELDYVTEQIRDEA